MKIQLENGLKIEVEDGATPAQIDEIIKHVTVTSPRTGEQGLVTPEVDKQLEMAERAGQSQKADSIFANMVAPIARAALPTVMNPAEAMKGQVQGVAKGLSEPSAGLAQTALNLAATKGLDGGAAEYLNRQREAENLSYEAQRASRGEVGLDIPRMVGAGLATAPVAAALPSTAGMTFWPRLAANTGIGAGSAALMPVDNVSEGYWQQKGQQALLGGAAGALGTALTAGAHPATKITSARGQQLTSGKYNPDLPSFYKTPSPDELKAASGAMYRDAQASNSQLTPEFTNKVADEIQGISPQTELGKIFSGNDRVSQLAEKFNAARGKGIDLKSLQEVDESISDMIDSAMDGGRVTKQAYKLMQAQDKLRQMVASAGEGDVAGGKEGFAALERARQVWADARRMDDIKRVIDNAQMFDNPSTAIKTGLRTIARNKARMNGFTPEQQEAIRKAAQSGELGDMFRTFGSRLSGIISLGTGNIGGAAAGYVGGKLSRDVADNIWEQKAQGVMDMIGGKYANRFRPLDPNMLMNAAPNGAFSVYPALLANYYAQGN